MKTPNTFKGPHAGREAEASRNGTSATSVESLVRKRTAALEARFLKVRRTAHHLLEQKAHLASAQAIAGTGSWEWDLATDRIHCTRELNRIQRLSANGGYPSFQAFLEPLHPADRGPTSVAILASRETLEPFSYYARILLPDGTTRTIHGRGETVATSAGTPVRVTGTCQDVTDRVALEKTLAYQARQAERSNVELRQFAHVVSHDLQEPLRTIAAFTRLLDKRYAGRLDGDADDMIEFIVNGTQRMQALLDGLLTYCRVERRALNWRLVDSREVFREAVANLHARISETGARVTASALPLVEADPALLAELFQNLIANALKYRSRLRPRIRVSAVADGWLWRFAVRDNGIGIDPAHHQRVFVIFQRLHPQDAYPGIGIGLSVCKKIAEIHGGRIWVESEAGRGAAFHFTIPGVARDHEPHPAKTR
ncbi:MAG: PAS domain-containing protein [Elusimicrobia bacterium]|nr:PAS domain-containing protein [Elusimicrobiota bacterium]